MKTVNEIKQFAKKEYKPFLAKVVVVPCYEIPSHNHCRTKMKNINVNNKNQTQNYKVNRSWFYEH